MRPSLARRAPRTAIAIACALTVASCASTPVDEVRISVKRIALKLAFENEALAKPVSPEQIIRYIPAPDDLLRTGDIGRYRTLPDRGPEPLCPAAPAGARLTQPVAVTIGQAPKPGWYRRHNRGKLSIAGGVFPITVPFPPITLIEIRDVHEVQRPKIDGGGAHHAGNVASNEAPPAADAAGSAAGTAPATRFTVAHQIATLTVTDVYEYDEAGFRLVKRTTATTDGTSEFNPTPQITMVELGDFGNDWNEAGADDDNDTAMVVRGEITAQQPVDACGMLVDSLRFENDEQMVNLGTQDTAGTSENPNVYNIAPQHNGLIVREEKHFTQVVTVGEGKLVIDWDYVSTLANLEPYATRADALRGVL